MDTCQNSPVFITLIVTVTPALVSMDTEMTFNTQNNRVLQCCDWLPRTPIEVYLAMLKGHIAVESYRSETSSTYRKEVHIKQWVSPPAR